MSITPSREEFHSLAKQGNLIPVSFQLIADMETPVSAYYKLSQHDDGTTEPLSFLLESVEGGENIGRYSFLGVNARSTFTQRNGVAVLKSNGKEEVIEGKDVFDRMHKVMGRFKPVNSPNLPPFVGGAVGYASYDIVSEIEPTVIQPDNTPLDTPEAFMMFTESLVVFDKVQHNILIINQVYLDDDEKSLDAYYDNAVTAIHAIIDKLNKPIAFPMVTLDDTIDVPPFESNKTLEEYKTMVERTKQYIFDGDIIQAVLSQRFSMECPYSSLAVYRALRMVNPSPYMFLLQCDDFSIVGASPEVHAKSEKGKITVRPIAGTRKRGKTEEEDKALGIELLADPKERAEHIMLVDLGRNDLGRVAKPGTVSVDDLMVIERYSHVMHIVSNVTAELDEKFESDAVMRATFPAGTLSGAPKVRAMQIISELEGERRGPYGGTVAYYSFNGDINSCITIRTAVLKDNKAYIQSGAGVVADSDPTSEFEETQNKAKAMLKALSLAQFFEQD